MFSGSITALVTPFKNNQLDEKAYAALIDWQIDQGTHGLVPCGTTGESATLSHEEHMRAVSICVDVAAGRVPVIAGAGSNSTEEAIGLVNHAATAGADAVLCVTPYYNRPGQRGLIEHYTQINNASNLPIILYNVPARTRVDLHPETIAVLAKLNNVMGLKDASTDLSRIAYTEQLCGADFLQLSGEDPTAIAFNASGGKGCISVVANVAPKLCAQMQEATLKGDYDTARQINARLVDLQKALFMETNPAPSKYALSKLDFCENEVRSPMVPVTSETEKVIEAAMDGLAL